VSSSCHLGLVGARSLSFTDRSSADVITAESGSWSNGDASSECYQFSTE